MFALVVGFSCPMKETGAYTVFSRLQSVKQGLCVHLRLTYTLNKRSTIPYNLFSFHTTKEPCMWVDVKQIPQQAINYRLWLVYDATTPWGLVQGCWIRSWPLCIYRQKRYSIQEVGHLETFMQLNSFTL